MSEAGSIALGIIVGYGALSVVGIIIAAVITIKAMKQINESEDEDNKDE